MKSMIYRPKLSIICMFSLGLRVRSLKVLNSLIINLHARLQS